MTKLFSSLILFPLLLLLVGCTLPSGGDDDTADLLLDKTAANGILELAKDEQNNRILKLSNVNNDRVKNKILIPLGAGTSSTGNFEVDLLYVSKKGTSNGDAKSWKTARNNLYSLLSEISRRENPPSPTQLYLILVAAGTYEPENPSASYGFNLKKHVGIIGGWDSNNRSIRSEFSQTIFSGKKSTSVFRVETSEAGVIYGSVIQDGAARVNGGGIYNEGTLYLTNVKLLSNTAKSNGGGLYNSSSASAFLENVVFRKNSANQSGGGFYNSSGKGSLENILFTDNTAGSEGGGFANASNITQISLINTTLVNNRAQNKGGGISNYGSIFILSSTMTGNSASIGSAVYGGGLTSSKTKLLNSIVWNNIGGTQIHIDSGAEMRAAYSIIQNFVPTDKIDDATPQKRGIFSPRTSQVFADSNSVGTGDPLLSSVLEKNTDDVYITLPWSEKGKDETENKGVYVKKGSGTDYYYGETGTVWFPIGNLGNANPQSGTLPSGAQDVNGKDARGYSRKDRPDLGPYERSGTAPSS